MTLKEAKQILKHHKVSIKRTEWNDYRINILSAYPQEATAYYTDDIEDALDTGMKMSELARNHGIVPTWR